MKGKLFISLVTIIIVAILYIAHLSSCHLVNGSKILCVSASENAAECTTFMPKYKCTICQPLSSYVLNVSNYLTSNVKMIFAMGEHCLRVPNDYGESIVNLTEISNFTMKGLGNISYNMSEEGAIQPSSVITCSCSQKKSGILFYKSNTIHIENLAMEDCGTTYKGIDYTLISALIFIGSYDIKLVQIRMNRNMGYGLDAAHLLGNMIISNSSFLRCVAYNVVNMTVCGNAKIQYSYFEQISSMPTLRTDLLIHNSWFLYAGQNNKLTMTQSNFAGGLSVFIDLPNVNVLISHIKAMHNIGGNVVIWVNDYHKNTSSVSINNSTIAHGSAVIGGGLNIWVEVIQYGYNYSSSVADVNTSLNVVAVLKTNFTNNSAIDSGGGVFIVYYEKSITDHIKRHVTFIDCKFIGNSLQHDQFGAGAAVYIFKHPIPETAPQISPLFSFRFTNCTFDQNKLTDNQVKVMKEGGIVMFIYTNGIIIEDSNFTSNEGTAIFLKNSIVQFSGHIIFRNNSAMHGGALKFCQLSKMYFPVGYTNVHIDFINNSASSTGGAIFVQDQCADIVPLCFFQPACTGCVNPPVSDLINITLQFVNNTAKLAGDAIYGGQIDYCSMNIYWKYNSTEVFATIFNLTQQSNISQSIISSTPYGACFCNVSNGIVSAPFCGDMPYNGEVIPGQKISIGVAAVGQKNGTVPTISVYFEFISVQIESSNTTQLIINNTFQVNQQCTHCNILDCTVYSDKKRARFKLILQQVNPVKISYSQDESPYLTVFIKECPWGFVLSNTTPFKCVCDGLLTSHDISCTIDTQTVTIPGRHYYWLGCSSSNGSNCRGLSLAVHCLLGYCKDETITISPETLELQCSDGREGVLCGRCKQNHSLALGTSRCLPKCPNYFFYIILIVYATSGILVILFLIACNFTVSEGILNGLFFYAHVVHRNSDSFFPGSAGASNANIFRLFVAWLNLDPGFEICFYKSMTQYHKAWIQCGFLFYLCILELAIIILSHKYIFFTRLFGRNIVKVLATLFLVCCAKMIDIGITSLELAHIRHSDGPRTIVWLFDGNIPYCTGKHIPLFVLGLMFYSFALVYTLILLFIQCLQRRSNVCCLQWIDRWRPFFEAYTSPCRINYRFWPGFLFFVRLTLFTFGSLLRNKPTINLHITTAACVVILIFAIVSPTGVYKHWPLNVLEFSFLINLGVLSTLVAMFCHSSGPQASSFVYPSVAIAMVLFVCIVSYYCIKRLMPYNCFQKLIQSGKEKFSNLIWREVEEEEEAEPFLN